MRQPCAFPSITEYGDLGHVSRFDCGMTLRDYFAAKVVQGQMAIPDERRCPSEMKDEPEIWRAKILMDDARFAYKFADFMLKARGE